MEEKIRMAQEWLQKALQLLSTEGAGRPSALEEIRTAVQNAVTWLE